MIVEQNIIYLHSMTDVDEKPDVDVHLMN